MDTFIDVLLGLTEVLTVVQCSFMSSYTNSQIYSLRNIFPTASRFLHQTGLPTHRSTYRFTYSASPIGPNRSSPWLVQPIRPMLSLSLNMDIPLANEVLALFLLGSLPDNWETLVVILGTARPEGKRLSLARVKSSLLDEARRRDKDTSSDSKVLLTKSERGRQRNPSPQN